MKIKLWKDNLKAKEYEMEASEIIKGFLKSEYYQYYNVNRWLSVYISDELNSVFETEKFELLKKEYFKQKNEKEK